MKKIITLLFSIQVAIQGYAETIFIKVSNQVFKVQSKNASDFSSEAHVNQLIDLLKDSELTLVQADDNKYFRGYSPWCENKGCLSAPKNETKNLDKD